MKILVTGGAGFIGSNLTEELVLQGHQVRILDNFITGRRDNLEPFSDKVEVIEGDIRSPFLCLKACRGMDAVVHLAALNRAPRSLIDPEAFFDVNERGTINMLMAASECGVEKLLIASSSSVYGDHGPLATPEDHQKAPTSPYGVSKMNAEAACKVLVETCNIKLVQMLRFFSVFGPKQLANGETCAAIPKLIRAAWKGIPFPVYGDGFQTRDFTYVGNVVSSIIEILNWSEWPNQFEIMNIAEGFPVSINSLITEVQKYFNPKIKIGYQSARAGDFKHSLSDPSNMRTGVKSSFLPFQEGLSKTVSWYLNNRERLDV